MSASPPHLSFDEITMDNQFPPVECDVQEVIEHEVSMGGGILDFPNNFPSTQQQANIATTQTLASVGHDQSSFTSGHHWVH